MINTDMLYMKVVDRVNTKSSHYSRPFLFHLISYLYEKMDAY